MNTRYSITSNEVKLFKHLDRLQDIQNRIIRPVLLHLSTTNKCDSDCMHCCFSERDKSLEMDYSDTINAVIAFRINAVSHMTGILCNRKGGTLSHDSAYTGVEVCHLWYSLTGKIESVHVGDAVAIRKKKQAFRIRSPLGIDIFCPEKSADLFDIARVGVQERHLEIPDVKDWKITRHSSSVLIPFTLHKNSLSNKDWKECQKEFEMELDMCELHKNSLSNKDWKTLFW